MVTHADFLFHSGGSTEGDRNFVARTKKEKLRQRIFRSFLFGDERKGERRKNKKFRLNNRRKKDRRKKTI